LSSTIGRTVATVSNFYVSHSSATRFLRNGNTYHIYLVDNSLLFPTVKEFLNWLAVDEVIAKSWIPRFLKHCVVAIDFVVVVAAAVWCNLWLCYYRYRIFRQLFI